MISRYEVKEMTHIWSDENKFQKFLEVERALLDALEEKKQIPAGTLAAFSNVKINIDRINELERTTQHDVISFCTSITEQVEAKFARYFHFGATSSDIIDTALSLQLRDAAHLVRTALEELIKTCLEKARETEDLLAVGRSHGMYAEPMIFGQKFLSFAAELMRRKRDYDHILQSEITGQFSGAVGSYTILSPEIEAIALKKLGLNVEHISSQVIPRDHLALIISIGAMTGVALERMAVEIRQLHQSDVAEVQENFKMGQKGSSTMPHKKNPIAAENITGLARVLKSHQSVAMENCVLWYERDISHSSAERMMLPDHFGILVYALRRFNQTLKDLVIDRENISKKVQESPKLLSSYVLHHLIDKNERSREEIYQIVQSLCFAAKDQVSFWSNLKAKVEEEKLQCNIDFFTPQALLKHYQRSYKAKLTALLAGQL